MGDSVQFVYSVKGSISLHFEKKDSLLHRLLNLTRIFKLISRVVEQMVNVLTLLTCNIDNFASLFRFIDTYPQTYLGCARFPGFVQNFSERQILWSLCSVDFHTFTLQLLIQTPHSVALELQVLVSSHEKCQNFSKTSTPQAQRPLPLIPACSKRSESGKKQEFTVLACRC